MSDNEHLERELEELSTLDKDDSSLLEEFLMNQPKDIQRRVLKTIRIWGIDRNDPIFLVLLQCRINQILYELVPSEIQQVYDNGKIELIEQLEQHQEKLFQEQQEQIKRQQKTAFDISLVRVNNAISKVMEDNNVSYKNRRFSPRTIGSMVASCSILISASLGFFGGRVFDNTPVANSWRTDKNAREQLLLDWAKSEKGQLAKNIVEWNEDLASQRCQQKVRSLNVSFRIGSGRITSGFCVLFVAPPEERTFIDLKD